MRIKVTPSEYADFTVAFLLDKLLNQDEVVADNEDFNKLAEVLESKGVKPLLLKYYISMDSKMRVKYKRLKGSFTDEEDPRNTIDIIQSIDKEKKEPEKRAKSSFIKDIVKSLIPKILKAETSLSYEEAKVLLLEEVLEEIVD